MTEGSNFISLTADIVAAHVSNNSVPASDIPGLIRAVHDAFTTLGEHEKAEPEESKPAVSIRSSVKPDYIVCLEDGKKLQMMKRYLRTNFDMSPEEYRQKWGLPRNYPMVAPNYSNQRREMAKKIGLGRKLAGTASETSEIVTAVAPKRASSLPRTTKAKAKTPAAPVAAPEAPIARRRGRPKKQQ